jgi:hypothetical protein
MEKGEVAMNRKTILLLFGSFVLILNLGIYYWREVHLKSPAAMEETLTFDGISIRQMEFVDAGEFWVLTDKDLRLYNNGILAEVFDANHTPALANNGAANPQITIDRQGNVWVANPSSASLGVYKNQKWTQIQVDTFISAFAIDPLGVIWAGFELFGNDGAKLEIIERNTRTSYTKENSPLSGHTILDIAFDEDGRAWLATNGGGIFVTDGSHWENFNTENSQIPGNLIRAIVLDEADRAWVAADAVSVFDGNSWTSYSDEAAAVDWENISDIAVDHAGRVWVVFDFGAGARVFDGESWANVEQPVEFMATDMSGNVWLYNDFAAYNTSPDMFRPVPLPVAQADFVMSTGAPLYLAILTAGLWLMILLKAEKDIRWVLTGFGIYLLWIYINIPHPLPLGESAFHDYGPLFFSLNPGTYGTFASLVGAIAGVYASPQAEVKPADWARSGLLAGSLITFCFVTYEMFLRDL